MVQGCTWPIFPMSMSHYHWLNPNPLICPETLGNILSVRTGQPPLTADVFLWITPYDVPSSVFIVSYYVFYSRSSDAVCASARQQGRALITFAGMLPYHLPGDVTTRLVQNEALMNWVLLEAFYRTFYSICYCQNFCLRA